MRAGDSLVGLSVATARRTLTDWLRDAHIDTPELDARLLTGFVLGLDLTGLISGAHRILTEQDAAQLADAARRRLAGEPIARILGSREFWGLPLQLSAQTLVPRPDTETVIEAVLQALAPEQRRAPLRIADLGTGSGAILLALLSELPAARGIGTDINDEALRTARANAGALGLGARVDFVLCDYAAALADGLDIIVSNPPYIPSADIAMLEIEVRDHDPLRALDGGADGLDAYRVIAPDAGRLLVPGGLLVLEVGHGQSTDVAALMTASGLALPGPAKTDLGGVRRAVIGRKKP